MLVNPELSQMTGDDLNQRYSNTFVQYDGRLVWIDLFDGEGKRFLYQDHSGMKYHEKFEYTKLNIERPGTGWLAYEEENMSYPFYLAYRNDRQWKRGTCDANMYVFSPTYNDPSYFLLYEKAYQNRELFKYQFPTNLVVDRVKRNGFIILQNNLALISHSNKIQVYFRNTLIGDWKDKTGFTLLSDVFKEELQESIPDLAFSLAKPNKINYGEDPPSRKKKTFVHRNAIADFVQRDADVVPVPQNPNARWIFDWIEIPGLDHDTHEEFDYSREDGPYVVDPTTGVSDPDILANPTITERVVRNMLIRLRNYRARTQGGQRVFPGDLPLILHWYHQHLERGGHQ